MFYFELRNVISIPCVIFTHGNGNNVKKGTLENNFYNF